MATLEGLPGIELFIRQRVEEQRKTHQEVSDELMFLHPGVRGLSRMSVRRFCCEHNIHKTSRLDDRTLDRAVALSVMRVGFIWKCCLLLFLIRMY